LGESRGKEKSPAAREIDNHETRIEADDPREALDPGRVERPLRESVLQQHPSCALGRRRRCTGEERYRALECRQAHSLRGLLAPLLDLAHPLARHTGHVPGLLERGGARPVPTETRLQSLALTRVYTGPRHEVVESLFQRRCVERGGASGPPVPQGEAESGELPGDLDEATLPEGREREEILRRTGDQLAERADTRAS